MARRYGTYERREVKNKKVNQMTLQEVQAALRKRDDENDNSSGYYHALVAQEEILKAN